MDAHALLARDGEHAEGIGVAQVGLGGEGKAPQVFQPAQIVGMDAGRLAFGAIRRLVVVGVTQRVAQPFELQAAQGVERDGGFREHHTFESKAAIGVAQPDQRRAQAEERKDAQQPLQARHVDQEDLGDHDADQRHAGMAQRRRLRRKPSASRATPNSSQTAE